MVTTKLPSMTRQLVVGVRTSRGEQQQPPDSLLCEHPFRKPDHVAASQLTLQESFLGTSGADYQHHQTDKRKAWDELIFLRSQATKRALLSTITAAQKVLKGLPQGICGSKPTVTFSQRMQMSGSAMTEHQTALK